MIWTVEDVIPSPSKPGKSSADRGSRVPVSLAASLLAVLFAVCTASIFPGTRISMPNYTFEGPYKNSRTILTGLTELKGFIRSEMRSNRIDSLSIAVFNRRTTLYAEAFGEIDSDKSMRTATNTVFQAASLGKMVTAYAVMMLVERGLIALDEPAQKYLASPYLRDSEFEAKITVRMLLNHTSGLKNDPDGRDRHVYFRPGSCFSYSGSGYRYLQAVIEAVSGRTFDGFIETEIFRPLGMSSSTFNPAFYGGLAMQEPLPEADAEVNAAYSLVSTPSDLARFLRELQSPSLVDGRLVLEMLSPSVRANNHNFWGLGAGLQKTPGGYTVWHWGKNRRGFDSLMVMDLGSSVGCVIMTRGAENTKCLKRIAAMAIGGWHYGYWIDIPSDLVRFPPRVTTRQAKPAKSS